MCRETGPSPSHCSLGAGWDAAGGGGEGGFSQHLAGERLVAVCDGARDAVSPSFSPAVLNHFSPKERIGFAQTQYSPLRSAQEGGC